MHTQILHFQVQISFEPFHLARYHYPINEIQSNSLKEDILILKNQIA